MINESSYMELMKNCSKWNTRAVTERKTRFRYPFYDQQTGTAQRPTPNYYKKKEQRYYSEDPNTVMQYACSRWKKSGESPSDALEMKMFLRDNPALEAALNQSNNSGHHQHNHSQPAPLAELIASDASNDSISFPKSTPKQHVFSQEDFVDELDEDISPGSVSDEDDWGSKKKKKNAAGGSSKKKKASAARPREPHACSKCGAKYKSIAGLMYHNAFVHNDPSPNSTNKLLSPSIEVSDFCDLCLGNRFKNKTSNKAEDLVTCHDCGRSGHPSCLSFNQNVSVIINRYGWQCIECKSCTICGTSENDDQLLFCDDCDRGFHLYCLTPPLKKAPDNEYSCVLCQKEFGPRASAPAKK